MAAGGDEGTSERARATPSDGRRTAASLSRRSVLIVDDNADLAENLVEIFGGEGFEARSVTHPRRALEMADEFEFDAAIIDLRLPDMDGVALHRELCKRRPVATYVLISAFANDAKSAEALRNGIVEVLPKPLPVERLLALVSAG